MVRVAVASVAAVALPVAGRPTAPDAAGSVAASAAAVPGSPAAVKAATPDSGNALGGNALGGNALGGAGGFGGGPGGGGAGGLLDASTPSAAVVAALQADAGRYTLGGGGDRLQQRSRLPTRHRVTR